MYIFHKHVGNMANAEVITFDMENDTYRSVLKISGGLVRFRQITK